ncbi:MAG: HEAT repeat domain-containing protein [Candidatus Omnitrophota bacterium]
MADNKNIPELLIDLEDIHPITRKQAIQSLSNLGDKSIIPELIKILLNDESSSVRQAVAQSFQKGLSDKCTVPALIKALKDPDESVRGAAAAALGAIKDKSAVPYLCAALKDESEHVRWSVIYPLAKIGDKAAIEALKELISNPEEISNIKGAAKEALRQLRMS